MMVFWLYFIVYLFEASTKSFTLFRNSAIILSCFWIVMLLFFTSSVSFVASVINLVKRFCNSTTAAQSFGHSPSSPPESP